jgi:hypothetical protein
MTYRTRPLLLALAGLVACGPGTSTTEDSSSSTDGQTTDGQTTDVATTEPPTTGTSTTDVATTDVPTTAASEATTTVSPTTGDDTDAACPDPLPQEGEPCSEEGQFCGPGCEDPCEFCNVVTCERGQWEGLEVFPNECLDCDTVCDFVVVPGCAGGPPDKATCVAGCQETLASECMLDFHKMLSCIGPMPTFACDDLTRPVVAGCEPQFDALYACMG